MVFDDEFSTVTFMKEGTISPICTVLVKRSPQSGAPENIEVKDTSFNPYLEEDPRETQTHVPIVMSENNRSMITLLWTIQ